MKFSRKTWLNPVGKIAIVLIKNYPTQYSRCQTTWSIKNFIRIIEKWYQKSYFI